MPQSQKLEGQGWGMCNMYNMPQDSQIGDQGKIHHMLKTPKFGGFKVGHV